MLQNLNNSNGCQNNAVLDKKIKDLQEEVSEISTALDDAKVTLAELKTSNTELVSCVKEGTFEGNVSGAEVVARDKVVTDAVASHSEDVVTFEDDVKAPNITADSIKTGTLEVNGRDFEEYIDDVNNAKSNASDAVTLAESAVTCAENVQQALNQYKTDNESSVTSAVGYIGNVYSDNVNTNALTVNCCFYAYESSGDTVGYRAAPYMGILEPTEKDEESYYQFHLPSSFNGRFKAEGLDAEGNVLFAVIIDTSASKLLEGTQPEGTALIVHSAKTINDFYQVLRRKDRHQISFITQSQVKRLSYQYEATEKVEPTYDILPNLTDGEPDYTLYEVVYTAIHTDQVVVLGNEKTLNGGFTVLGSINATALDFEDTEFNNIFVKQNIGAGYDTTTGSFTTCGTPGAVLSYNRRDSGLCTVSWVNGCPRQVVRKGECYGKDGYDNECSYLIYETVKTTDTDTGLFKPAATDCLFDEDGLAHYNGTTAIDTDNDTLYPIKHLGNCTCVHGELEVECNALFKCCVTVCEDACVCGELVTNCLRSDTDCSLNISTECDLNVTAENDAYVTSCCNLAVEATCTVVCADCNVVNGETTFKDDVNFECHAIFHSVTIEDKVCGRLEVTGDVRSHGQLISDGDAVIHGDLYVEGTTTSTHEKEVTASGDYITLREGNNTTLTNTEYSGIVVNNYAPNAMATLAVDYAGTWRVSDSTTSTSTCYDDISNYNDNWYEGLTTTATTVIKGITKDASELELSDVVLDTSDDSYYHHDGDDWYGPISVVSGAFDIGSKITDETLIATLDGLTRADLVYYNHLEIATIDASENQPLMTRAEEDDFESNDLLVWDENEKKAVPLVRPTEDKQVLIVSCLDAITGCKSYKWEIAPLMENIFDVMHPIGSTYVQYPQTASPNDLWSDYSTWEEISYGGAFFRASGGSALGFADDSVTLTSCLQSQATAKNGLCVYGNSQTITTCTTINTSNTSAKSLNHNHSMANGTTVSSVKGTTWALRGEVNFSGQNTTTCADLNHRHQTTFTPSVSMCSSDTETRPANYTVRIWKRVA